jgi:hypothetical protein
VYECESECFRSLGGGCPFPFYKSKGREWLERDRESAKRDHRDHAASPLRVGIIGTVDDDGCAPMLCPEATCTVPPNGTGGASPSSCRTGDLRPAKMGGVTPRRVLRLDPQPGCDALRIHQIKSRARVLCLKAVRRQNPSPNPF